MIQRFAPVFLCALALIACEGSGPSGNNISGDATDGSGADGGVDLGDVTNPDGIADADTDADPDAITDAGDASDAGDAVFDTDLDAGDTDGSGDADGATDALFDALPDVIFDDTGDAITDVLLDDTGDIILPDDADGSGDTGDTFDFDLDGFTGDIPLFDADPDVDPDADTDVDPDADSDADPDVDTDADSDTDAIIDLDGFITDGSDAPTEDVQGDTTADTDLDATPDSSTDAALDASTDADPDVMSDVIISVDCEVSDWTDWGECNVLCGGGVQTRTRTIVVEPVGDGASCPVLEDTRPCNTEPCDVDCELGDWSDFGACSAACGGGTRTRTRDVLVAPSGNGAACGLTEESEPCNTEPCPVDCELSEFTDWGDCSEVCGDGVQTRTREVIVEPANGGEACGELLETRPCNDRPCTDDCIVSAWTPFTLCSASCGGGISYREREIIRPPQHGGAACPTVLYQEVACNTQPCPVDCEVGDFTQATSCSAACGEGVEIWTREVIVEPANGGDACPPLEEECPCSGPPCPIDCEVGDWTPFSECTAVCDGGEQTRTREITRPAEFGGADCPVLEETVACNTQACPPPQWEVGDWSACTDGQRTRTRACVSAVTGEVVSDGLCTDTPPATFESCEGFDCDPADPCCTEAGTLVPAGNPCRTSRGSCDIADTCDGVRGICPERVRPPGEVCFATVGFTFYAGRCLEGLCLSEAYGCSVAMPGSGLPYPCTNTADPCGTGYSCRPSEAGICESNLDPFGDGSDGIPCTPAGQAANSGMCQSGVCRTNTQLKRYEWVPLAWGPCAAGMQTRLVLCQDETGTTVPDASCTDPRPAGIRACTPIP